jgi:hypothetical protein
VSAGQAKRRPVGFWRNPDAPSTASLPDPHDLVDPDWDPRERAAVIAYLRGGDVVIYWQGHSWCRFHCGIPNDGMGAGDFTDGEWIWPEGLPHYLEAHAVRPPEEFLEHVRRRLRERDRIAPKA